MSIWTDFIKEYAKKHHITYGCALSQYKVGLKKAYDKFKKGEEWFDVEDVLDVNEEIKQKKGIEKKKKHDEEKEIEKQKQKKKEDEAKKKKEDEAKKEQKKKDDDEASSFLKKKIEEARKKREEDIKIPEPITAPKDIEPVVDDIEEKVKELEKIGREKGGVHYSAYSNIVDFTYLSVLIKFKGECIPAYKDLITDTIVSSLTINTDEKLTDRVQIVQLRRAIEKCIKRNIPVICIYLRLNFGKKGGGHANLLIYRPFERVVERFEPHGEMYGRSINDNTSVNSQLKKIFEIDYEPSLGKIRYYPPNEICPYAKGFQLLESQIQGLQIEGGGFCVMWSLFVMEMILNNPTKSTKEIIEKVFEITNQDPQFLKNVIRGYVVGTEKLIDKTLRIIKNEGFSYSNTGMIKGSYGKINPFDKVIFDYIFDLMFKSEQDIREPKEFKPLPAELQEKINPIIQYLQSLTKTQLSELLDRLAGRPVKLKGSNTKDALITHITIKYPEQLDALLEALNIKKELEGRGMYLDYSYPKYYVEN
jgi:hypothetical protein